MSISRFLVVIFLLFHHFPAVVPQLCDIRHRVNSYILAPDSFFGSSPLSPQFPGCNVITIADEPNAIVCEGMTLLFDENFGPQHPNLNDRDDLDSFVGWSTESFLSIDFQVPLKVSAIGISVIHNPQREVGVPSFELYTTTLQGTVYPDSSTVRVSFDFLNNDQLNNNSDSEVKNITLRLRTPATSQFFLLRWTFTDLASVKQFGVSEARMCGGDQPVNTPEAVMFQAPVRIVTALTPTAEYFAQNSELNLTCTVSNQGSFSWEWRRDGGDLPAGVRILSTDATRTSVLSISNLNEDLAGAYTCMAITDLQPSLNAARQFDLPLNLTLEGMESVMGFRGDGFVTLNCEASGYTSISNPSITWSFNDQVLPDNSSSSKYSISEEATGMSMLIFFNGSSSSSLVSTLEISDLNEDDEGDYSCSLGGATSSTQLSIMMGTAPTTTPPTTTEFVTSELESGPSEGSESSSAAVVVGVVVVLVILILVIIAVLILVILFLHYKRKSNSYPSRRKSTSSIMRRRKPSVTDSSDQEMHRRLTKADIEWQIEHVQNGINHTETDGSAVYAVVNKSKSPSTTKLPAQNFLETNIGDTLVGVNAGATAASGEEPTMNFYVEAADVSPPASSTKPNTENHDPQMNIYEEARPIQRRMTNSSTPKLAKLKKPEASHPLDHNPIYESSSALPTSDNDMQALVQPEKVTEIVDVVYAQPIKRKPSASSSFPPPKNAPEPPAELSSSIKEKVYSEALNPAMFKQPPPDPSVPMRPYAPIYAEPTTIRRKLHEKVKLVEPANFKEHGLIGMGEFGEVVLAETIGLSRSDLGLSPASNDRSSPIKVAIKKLRRDAENPVRENFEREIRCMSGLKDENIVTLLAVHRGSEPFLVMEYMGNGDLHQFLEDYQMIVTDPIVNPGQIHVSVLVHMCMQIASGMKYLASHGFVHRDLATRNCLVGENFTVKIADFGMSRNLYGESYYKVKGRAMLPIRWMASESFFGRFSEKTDVWSFGVVMWEIFTLCKSQPYEELEDEEIIQTAVKDHGQGRQRLVRPKACPERVYDVMLRCWETHPQERAPFKELYNSLSAIHQTL